MIRIILAALHLLALAIGFTGILMRGAALREPANAAALRRAMGADMGWGIAAVLWLGTGLWRYLGAVEKGMDYYNHNHFFLAKMGCFVLILALEVWPMVTLIRWRGALGRGAAAETVAAPAVAGKIAMISRVQAGLIVVMVFLAVAMARGYGVAAGPSGG